MPDDEAIRIIARDVGLVPEVGGHATVQDAVSAAVLGAPVAGTGTTLGFYGATPKAQAANIPDPAGGATVDAEARAAIVAILDVLEATLGVGLTA